MGHDIGGVEESRLIETNIYKSRLHARQDPAHAPFVDIADDTAPRLALDVDLLQDAAVNIGDARLRWRYVHQQFSRHVYPFPHAVR